MKEFLKSVVYGGMELATQGRGIERNIAGERVRFPVRYSRYYPRDYEPELFRFLYKHCTPGSTFLDCGAHFGLFSIVSSRLVGYDGKVIGFEPAPRIRRIFEQLVELNACPNVEIRPEAVSDSIGTATFFDTGVEASNANSLSKQNRHSDCYEVNITSIDEVINERDLRVRAIKIDVEGAEYGALMGAVKTLQRHRPAVFLSLHPVAITNMENTLGEIWDLLEGLGFQIRNLGELVSKTWFTERTDLFDVECIVPRSEEDFRVDRGAE